MACYLDLDQTPSTASPITNGKYTTKGLLVWTVTDTVAYALLDYCNLKAYNLILDVSRATILLLYLADRDALASALVAGNGSYILRPCGHDLHGLTVNAGQSQNFEGSPTT